MARTETAVFPRWVAAALAAALLALAAGGAYLYRSQHESVRRQEEEQLASVARLKADQLAAWRAEQLNDAAVLTESPFLAEAVPRFLADPRDETSRPILDKFRSLENHCGFENLLLVDPEGRLLLSLTGEPATHVGYVEALAAALRDRRPVLTELHTEPAHPVPHVSVVAPIFAGTGPSAPAAAAVVLVSEASRFLYPLIRSWPAPSESAESLLIRRDGDDVLFLNDLRHRPDTALRLRIPLSRTDVPAVRAVLGDQGVFEGRDYRGVEVVSAVLPVPGSPWYIVAKEDAREVFSEWRSEALLILALFASLTGGLAVLGLVAWQRSRKAQYRALYLSEAGRRAAAERHSVTLRAIGDGVVATDARGRVELLNPVAEGLTGWTEAEARGRTMEEVFRIFNERTGEKAEDPVERVLREGVVVGLANHTLLVSRDGAERPIADSGAPIRNEEGEITGVVLVFRDQTEQRAAEAERERLQAQLHQAQKTESIGRLAGGVAHDFNNMLGVIIGYAEMALVRTDPSSSLRSDLEHILNAAAHSADVTRQLLAFARKQVISPRVLDLNETVERMLRMLRRLIGENIELAWLPAGGPCTVRMDPSQIDQILANLCVNARDAIADAGKVTIETGTATFDGAYCADHPGFTPGDYVLLAMSDDGCGMDPGTLENLFEPFFTTKDVGKGTGLGLATVHGIVRQNEGFINVYSEPGKGTTFRIYLPRHAGEAEEVPGEAATEPVPQGRGETVLLVEDEPAVLELARTLLDRLGYEVQTADAPGEALRLAGAHAGRFHLLITDVVMPGMNGRELARRLREMHPGIKVLFMSGYTADVIARQGVLDPDVEFVEKPFAIRDLAVKVRRALDGPA